MRLSWRRRLSYLAAVARHRGELGRALALYAQSLALYRQIDPKVNIPVCLEGVAGIAVLEQQPERGVRLFGAAAQLREAVRAPLTPGRRALYDRDLAAALDEAAFAAAWVTGSAMSLDQAIEEAMGVTAEAEMSGLV